MSCILMAVISNAGKILNVDTSVLKKKHQLFFDMLVGWTFHLFDSLLSNWSFNTATLNTYYD